ncbi:hypothetical protein CLG96_05970 [Sphingomonas oleivorans]|uniref:Uncharacterized protein n=1 Tax=Sphingomonas oleivorans TaxID=1735121 RepID=A0A2T5FZH7_9SPHN|nr:hypothetical protein [Sphingomonas oleivorans]PTQ12110.1 hypothetical protein CLG96_05970 [Sphingomonas oleivorans]
MIAEALVRLIGLAGFLAAHRVRPGLLLGCWLISCRPGAWGPGKGRPHDPCLQQSARLESRAGGASRYEERC